MCPFLIDGWLFIRADEEEEKGEWTIVEKEEERERVRISIRKRATPFIPLVILKMFRLPVDKKIGDNNGVSEVANA